jgi:hypothetical protein
MNVKYFLPVLMLIIPTLTCKKSSDNQSSLSSTQAIVFLSKGSVTLKDSSGKIIPIEPKVTRIASDHTIETSKSSYADILLSDASIIRVYQNTKLQIQSILSVNTGIDESKVILTTGKLFVKTEGKINKDRNIVVTTPTTVAGIRGTEFTIEESEDQSTVLVGEGAVEGGTIDGEATVVTAGQKLDVANSEANVSQMSREELDSFAEESQSVASIVSDGRAEIQNILQNFQDEKAKILKTMEEKKSDNSKLIEDKKASDKLLINEQIDKNTEQMDAVKSGTSEKSLENQNSVTSEKEKIQNDAKSEMEKLKSGFKDM